MQVLKNEIRERILFVSESLFYSNGFNKTSTREIANKVKISVSNLYKYFKNKETIFDEIVRDYYINYKKNFNEFLSHEEETFIEERIATISHFILESIKGQHKRFVILMNKSDGTKYSDFKNEIISKLEQHMRLGTNESVKEKFIISIYARNFFYGIIEIANQYKNEKWAYDNIYLLVKYHMAGMSIFY